ncbi:MAG: XdhC family protein [Cyclobacteriaceae bacterium]|nr:XdhC family protein [Cyclobacteriaceae bacterium]
MKEIKGILETYEKLDFSRQKAALATVVRIQGSSYRQPGARMLILDDGHWNGAISGGCLEGDALRKAREVMRTGRPRFVSYDTTRDKPTDHIPFSMGCEGIIDVLIEPLDNDSSTCHPVRIFKEYLSSFQKQLIVTLYDASHESMGNPGERLHINHKGQVTDNFSNPEVREIVINETEKMTSWITSFHGEIVLGNHMATLFYEILDVPLQLLIFGGGYDVIPVVQMAKNLGWRVTVADECIAKTYPQKFPDADKVLNIPGIDVYREAREMKGAYALIMSHNFKYDLEVLRGLLKTDIGYLGVLGPKKRIKTMLDELKKEGKNSWKDAEKRIHAPVGLNMGAETPDEIAISIIAEILAVHNGKPGGFLKDKKGHIHDRETAVQVV